MAIQPITKMTAESYFQLDEYQEHDLIQLINGEVVIGMPPIPKHQDIVGEIFFLFKSFAKSNGGRAYTAPIEVYLDEHNVYKPDVLYMSPDSKCKVLGKRLEGAPELVVEVLSPSTAKYDKREKYAGYEQHGVQEYWIVDPVHDLIDVWTLDGGKFVHQGAYSVDDKFTSMVLKVDVEVKLLFAV